MFMGLERSYTLSYIRGNPNTLPVAEASAEACKDKASDDMSPPMPMQKKQQTTKTAKSGTTSNSMDTKFWRGLESELMRINETYEGNLDGYKR
jgi:hypothetical protein